MSGCDHAGSTVIIGYSWENGVRVVRKSCQACGANWTEPA